MVNCTSNEFLAIESLEVLNDARIKWLNMSGKVCYEVEDLDIGEVDKWFMAREVVLQEQDFLLCESQVNVPLCQLLV